LPDLVVSALGELPLQSKARLVHRESTEKDMRLIGAMFLMLLLAAPMYAGDNEQGQGERGERNEQEKKEQEKRRQEEMKKKEDIRKEELKKEERKGDKKDPLEEKARKLIKDQDKDGDGAIGETEAKGDIKAKFGELDSNDDNKVTPEEIQEFMRKRMAEEEKRKHEKQPAPKKEEPRKEQPGKEAPRKDGERPKKG
jgi:hypothetical protein